MDLVSKSLKNYTVFREAQEQFNFYDQVVQTPPRTLRLKGWFQEYSHDDPVTGAKLVALRLLPQKVLRLKQKKKIECRYSEDPTNRYSDKRSSQEKGYNVLEIKIE